MTFGKQVIARINHEGISYVMARGKVFTAFVFGIYIRLDLPFTIPHFQIEARSLEDVQNETGRE